MNALYELIGERISAKTYEAINPDVDFTNCKIEEDIRESFNGKKEVVAYCITPLWGSKPVDDFLKNVKFARITKDDYDSKPVTAFLRSNRTRKDEKDFIEILSEIEYYNGYGSQELFGVVVFNDGTWLSRWEYDGSEGWSRNSIPLEEEYFNDIKDNVEED